MPFRCGGHRSHKLSPIMVNGDVRCLRCDKRLSVSRCTKAEIADATKRAEEEFPSMSYKDPEPPPKYSCSKCKKNGVKLWREYNVPSSSLYCAKCGAKKEKEKIPDDLLKYDKIGCLVPAVPSEDGVGYWGYTSVPQEGVDWWHALPLDEK